MEAQIKKGIFEMCILHYISQESRYGYDIIRSMREYFPEVNESTFYAILRRLNAQGATTAFYGEKSKGPARKYYKITQQGKQELERAVNDWKSISSIVEKLGI